MPGDWGHRDDVEGDEQGAARGQQSRQRRADAVLARVDAEAARAAVGVAHAEAYRARRAAEWEASVARREAAEAERAAEAAAFALTDEGKATFLKHMNSRRGY